MKKIVSLAIFLTIFTGCTNTNDLNKEGSFNFKSNTGENISYTIEDKTIKQTKSFNENPQKIKNGYADYNITSCSKLIRNLAGKINYGYGAICQATKNDKQISIKVCENQAYAYKIGQLRDNEEVSLNSLAEFTSKYCYGG